MKMEKEFMKQLVREVSVSDFDSLRDLYLELTNGAPIPEGQTGEAKLEEILKHPGTTILGTEVEGKIVSVATLNICPNLTFSGRSYARIENVVTLTPYRGKGLARSVMEAAIQKAWNDDVCSIILLTGKSLGVLKFYEKFGFNANDKYGMILRFDD